MTELNKLQREAAALRELGEDWKENLSLLNAATRGQQDVLESIKRLCKKDNQGNLMRIGLTLIAFPFPIVIDDVLGWSFLAAGLVQRKIKNSAAYLEDLGAETTRIIKELQSMQQEML